MPRFYNLGDLIDRERDLDKTAIIDLGGELPPREVTYRALDEMANGVARALTARGLKRGERVAILSANRAEYLAAYYGIMRAGLVAVPVNFKFPRRTIHFILADAGAKLVFCDAARRADCPPGLPAVCFGGEGADSFEAFLDRGPFAAVVPHKDEPAMFLYTSGSTGVPKGVVLSHQSHLWVVEVRLAGQDLARHRYLIAAPLYHMNALALAKLACAAHATIVLLPQFTARDYIAAIGRYRCTWLTAVPPMIAMMLRESDALAQADLTSVRAVRMGSAPVNDTLAHQIRALLPNARIINAYGTTEGGPIVFTQHPDRLPTPIASVGYPHPGVSVRLVGPKAPETGVLQIRSPALMLGYHNRPETPSPITADGYYDTGDIFRRDEHGFHTVLGRTDDMFVSGGENIFPGEVELVIESHPDVLQACVVPVEDAIKGTKPVAFVVLRPGAAADEAVIKQHVLANAPAYQHPRRVWFLDAMLLASTNKIDRNGLRQRAAAAVRAS
jgi:long-chain acyl-CoA synthetase